MDVAQSFYIKTQTKFRSLYRSLTEWNSAKGNAGITLTKKSGTLLNNQCPSVENSDCLSFVI